MENIRLECPHCRQRLEIEASYAGTEFKCPVCGGEIVVPPPAAAGQGCGAPSYGPVGDDDGIARRKLSGAFKGYIGFTIAAIILWILFFCALGLLFVLAHPYSEEGGAVGGTGGAISVIIFLIGLLASCALFLLALIFKCILLYRLWRLVPPEEAATTPGKAVGFLFIPLFNLYWNFIAYGELGKYLRLMTGSSAPHILALIYSWLPVVGLALSFVRVFGVIVGSFTPEGGAVINIGAFAVGTLVNILSPVVDIAMMVSLTIAARRWRNWA